MLSEMKLRGTWRKIRSKIGIRSRRVAIHSHVPWYVKLGGYGIAMGIAAAIAWVIVDNSYRITGFSREEAKAQIDTLTAENAKFRQSYETTKSTLNEKESKLKVETAALAELTKSLAQIQDENASLKEDLGFLRNVMSSGSMPEGLAIQNFKVEADALPNEFRYRLLVTQGGQRKLDFKGKVQIIARLQQIGQAGQTVLSFPTDAEIRTSAGAFEFRFYQKIDGRFRIPEGAQLKNVQVRVLGLPGLDVRAQRNISL